MKVSFITKIANLRERISTEKKLLLFSIVVFLFAFTCFYILRNIIYSFITYNGKGTTVLTLNNADMDTLLESNYFKDQCTFKNIITCNIIDEHTKSEQGTNYLLFVFNKDSLQKIPDQFKKNTVVIFAKSNKVIIDKEFVYDGLLRKIYQDPYGNFYGNFYKEKRFIAQFTSNEDGGVFSQMMYFIPKF